MAPTSWVNLNSCLVSRIDDCEMHLADAILRCNEFLLDRTCGSTRKCVDLLHAVLFSDGFYEIGSRLTRNIQSNHHLPAVCLHDLSLDNLIYFVIPTFDVNVRFQL